MDKNTVFVVLVAGGAGVAAQLGNEAHHIFDISRLFAAKPSIEAPAFAILPHGNEPDRPGGPLRTPFEIANVTSQSSTSAVAQPTTLSSGFLSTNSIAPMTSQPSTSWIAPASLFSTGLVAPKLALIAPTTDVSSGWITSSIIFPGSIFRST